MSPPHRGAIVEIAAHLKIAGLSPVQAGEATAFSSDIASKRCAFRLVNQG
jgi:hypothetical protein